MSGSTRYFLAVEYRTQVSTWLAEIAAGPASICFQLLCPDSVSQLERNNDQNSILSVEFVAV